MDRFAKVKIINEIGKANNLNMGTLLHLLAVTNDKALTKLVADFQEKYPKKD